MMSYCKDDVILYKRSFQYKLQGLGNSNALALFHLFQHTVKQGVKYGNAHAHWGERLSGDFLYHQVSFK